MDHSAIVFDRAEMLLRAQAEPRIGVRRLEKLGAEKHLTPQDLKEVVIEGALMRVRPIMMTATAITAGLLPIMLGTGTGSEVMRRIAAPMVGGMISATLLALIVIPAIYFLWKRRRFAGKSRANDC